MGEPFADIAEAVVGVRHDPVLAGVILLLALSLARRKWTRLFSAFAAKGKYYTVTVKRKHGSLRVDLRANGSGRSMRLRISWKGGSSKAIK